MGHELASTLKRLKKSHRHATAFRLTIEHHHLMSSSLISGPNRNTLNNRKDQRPLPQVSCGFHRSVRHIPSMTAPIRLCSPPANKPRLFSAINLLSKDFHSCLDDFGLIRVVNLMIR
jgi:hypothetical protein